MFIESLQNLNPWWQERGLIDSDLRIEEFNAQPIQHHPPLLRSIQPDIPSILTLRGPRQVGKTTVIKLLIRRLLQNPQIDPRQILFYSCEDIDTYHNLIELFEAYFNFIETHGLKGKNLYLFLDEISFVEDWPRGVKALYERGLLKKAFLLISGSNSYDLHHQAERLPGRRGRIEEPDKLMLPVSFREFLEITDFPFKEKLPSMTIQEVLNNLSSVQKLAELSVIHREIENYLHRYFLTGGYLVAINDWARFKTISQPIYEIYLQWIKGDLVKLKRSEIVASHIFSQIIRKLLSRIDWSSIAKSIEIDSHKTIADYVRLLEDFFVLKTAYQFDISKKQVAPKKLKKVYFLDPFIFWAVKGWTEKFPKTFVHAQEQLHSLLPALAEQFIFNSLNYSYSASHFYDRTYFYTNKKGEEVDFIVLDEHSKCVGIELKYQNQYDRRDFKLLESCGVTRGILVTKETLELVSPKMAALPFYLWSVLKQEVF